MSLEEASLLKSAIFDLSCKGINIPVLDKLATGLSVGKVYEDIKRWRRSTKDWNLRKPNLFVKVVNNLSEHEIKETVSMKACPVYVPQTKPPTDKVVSKKHVEEHEIHRLEDEGGLVHSDLDTAHLR